MGSSGVGSKRLVTIVNESANENGARAAGVDCTMATSVAVAPLRTTGGPRPEASKDEQMRTSQSAGEASRRGVLLPLSCMTVVRPRLLVQKKFFFFFRIFSSSCESKTRLHNNQSSNGLSMGVIHFIVKASGR